MVVRLQEFGRAFATRERADEIVPELWTRGGHRLELDVEGVRCSTSFLIQLLSRSTERLSELVIVGADALLAEKINRLAERFGLSAVSVEGGHAAALA